MYSRLEGQLIWNAAVPLYADPRRAYHVLEGHVMSMYQWATVFGFSYCETLDKSIISHDVILDGLGNHEDRSANWLLAIDPGAEAAANLVRSTKDHVPLGGWWAGDWRLIALDVADFLVEEKARQNSRLVVEEARRFGDTRQDDLILKGIASYLSGLSDRLSEPSTDATLPFGKIRTGIEDTISRLKNGIL